MLVLSFPAPRGASLGNNSQPITIGELVVVGLIFTSRVYLSRALIQRVFLPCGDRSEWRQMYS